MDFYAVGAGEAVGLQFVLGTVAVEHAFMLFPNPLTAVCISY